MSADRVYTEFGRVVGLYVATPRFAVALELTPLGPAPVIPC
jgi:hypothetical protein